MPDTSTRLQVLYWNCRGIYSNKLKLTEFRQLVRANNYDLIFIAEPMLGKSRNPPKFGNYIHTTALRENRNAGGLILYYKKHLRIHDIYTIECTLENICIKINNTLLIGSYCKSAALNQEDIRTLAGSHNKTIIFGDLNAKHIDWNCTNNNANGATLKYILENSNLVLFATEGPTCYTNVNNPSKIDLILSNNVFINNLQTLDNLDSDHKPISFCLPHISHNIPNPVIQKDYSKANWKQYKNAINSQIQMNRNIITNNDIDLEITNLTNIIQNAIDEFIPNKSNHSSTLPQYLQDIIKLRNKFRRNYQKNPTNFNKTMLENQTALLSELLVEYDKNMWEARINSTIQNKGNVWPQIKKMKNAHSTHIPPLHFNNTTVACPTQKANIIAQHFLNSYTLTENLSDPNTVNEIANTLQNFEGEELNEQDILRTTPHQIKQLIKSSKPYAAPGHDNIQNKSLKFLPKKAIVQLFYIYQACLKNNYFPQCWKKANIIPILKKGKNPNISTSYRPISLLPALGKILEKIINAELKQLFFDRDFLIPEQFAFRVGHTTTLQLARLVNKIKLNYNINHTTSMALLDLEKAFDVVWIDALIYKMIKATFPSSLIKIIQSYLTNRTFAVKLSEAKSNTFQIPAGVPQGGVLSPTLFLIYLNDIPKNPNTQLALFADDTAIIANSRRTMQANTYINRHLQDLLSYFFKWKIQINQEKTKLINFNQKIRPENHQIVRINNVPIQTVTEIKYLGVKLDRKLNFNQHILELKQKVNVIINTLYYYFCNYSPLSTKLKLLLYKAYVQSVLLYACPVFISTSDANLKQLQIVENKVFRTVQNIKPYDMTVKQLHELCNTTPLLQIMYNRSVRFFQDTVQRSNLTLGMGDVHLGILPFRKLKHKLIHQRILDSDPTQ